MFYTAMTLKQLKEAVDDFIEAVGENAPVVLMDNKSSLEVGDKIYPDPVFLSWNCIKVEKILDKDGKEIGEVGIFVGSEADNYELKDGEKNIITIY